VNSGENTIGFNWVFMNICETIKKILIQKHRPKNNIKPWTVMQPFKKPTRSDVVINAVDWVTFFIFVIFV